MRPRISFVKAMTNKSSRHFTPGLNAKELHGKIEYGADQQRDSQKCPLNLSSSFQVSFNLDKLYFEDDESIHEVKQQNLNLAEKKKTLPSNTLSYCPNLSYQSENPIHTKQQLQKIYLRQNQPEISPKTQKLPKPEPSLPQHQLLEQQKNEEPISQQQEKRISIQPHRVTHESTFKQKEVQVDLPDEDYNYYFDTDTLLTPSQVSPTFHQIDLLFLNPHAAEKYNAQNPLIITIQELARIYPFDLKLYDFVQLHPSNSSQKQKILFQAFMHDWKKSIKRSRRKTLTLTKMRTIIVRDAMNALVDIIVPPTDTEDYHLRINKIYQQRYIKAGIPIPPSRVNNQFLEKLFSNSRIKDFYMIYVRERLQIYLQEENFRKMEIYTLEIMKCLQLAQLKTLEDLIELLDRKKKPFTNNEIEIIIKQAHQIGHEYGKNQKRIGNGNPKKLKQNECNGRREKIIELQQPFIQKPTKKVKIENTTINKFYGKESQQNDEIQEQYKSLGELDRQSLEKTKNKGVKAVQNRYIMSLSSSSNINRQDQQEGDIVTMEKLQSLARFVSKSLAKGLK